MTQPTQLVLQALLDDPAEEKYGIQIIKKSGLRSGTVHPILARLEEYGWVKSRPERINPAKAGRPPRRYYRLTKAGIKHAPMLLLRPATLPGDADKRLSHVYFAPYVEFGTPPDDDLQPEAPNFPVLIKAVGYQDRQDHVVPGDDRIVIYYEAPA
jgi:hypothetical protein